VIFHSLGSGTIAKNLEIFFHEKVPSAPS
jgi:hypothetical protein